MRGEGSLIQYWRLIGERMPAGDSSQFSLLNTVGAGTKNTNGLYIQRRIVERRF